MPVRIFTLTSRVSSSLGTSGQVKFYLGSNGISVPAVNLISPSTATSGLTPLYLVGISSDGKHVIDVDPATIAVVGSVASVNEKTGVVVLGAADVGADAAGAAIAAIASHVDAADPHTQYLLKVVASATYAALVSPVFTGVPTAPTATGGTQTAQLATTQFVSGAISAIPAANITAGTFSGAYVFANPVRLTVGPTNAPVVIRSAAYSDSIRPGDVLKYERGPTTGVVLVRDGINSFEFNPDNQFYNTTFYRVTLTTLFLSGVVAQMDGYAGIDGVTAGWHLTQYTGIYMCFGAKDYQGWGYSSTNTKRRLAGSVSTFIVNTDATYRGQRQHYAQDATGSRNTFREYTDGARGYIAQTVQTTAPIDADLNPSELAFYTDGSGQLKIKLKDSGGTVRTGTITLT